MGPIPMARGLRRETASARLLGLWVRIPPGAWMFVCCECCVLSGRYVRRADHSSRGVLPNVVCLNVIVILENEEALTPWGAVAS
jgi:hypothetical protein